MRESFVFHAEYIEDLPEEYKERFLRYVYEYGIHEKLPELTGLELTIWKKTQRRIDIDRGSYRNKVEYRESYNYFLQLKRNKTIDSDMSFSEFKKTENFKTFKSFKNFNKTSSLIDTVNDIDIVNDIDTDIDIDIVNVNEIDNDIVNDGAKAPEALSPSQSQLSKILLDIFQKAKLPCSRGNEISFLQRDFKNAIGFIHNSTQYKSLHSEDLIQACKNYAEVINDPDSYYKRKMDLYTLVQNKIFWNLLPDNFCKENFKNYKAAKTENEEIKPEVDYSHKGEEIIL